MRTTTLFQTSCLGFALLAGATLSAQTYTTQIINPPAGTTAAHADAMNNAGQVVGRTTVQVGSGRKATTVSGPGFLWSASQSSTLPTLYDMPYVEAWAISDAGLTVGDVYGSDYYAGRATWWENTGSGYQARDWNALVPPAWGVTLLRTSALSSDGQYASFGANFATVGERDIIVKVQLDATGKIPVALEAYWDVCDPWGITAVRHDGAGTVLASGLGGSDVANPGAFLWVKDADGTTTTYDRHSYSDSSTGAWGVTLGGSMAGFRRSSSAYQAVVWDAAGTMSDLGTLGGSQSYAEAINDAGVVVGWSSTKGKGKNDGPQHAFVWSGGTMVDLNNLMISGPTVTKPRAINNAGQIVAWSGSTSVLLTPQ